MVNAVEHRIENFNLSRDEQDSLRREIEHVLNSLIDKADSMISAPQKSLKGKLQKFAFKTFVNTKSLHEQVPSFSSDGS